VCKNTRNLLCFFFIQELLVHTYMTQEQEEHLNKTKEIINNNNNVVYIWNRRLVYRFVHFNSCFLCLLWKVLVIKPGKSFSLCCLLCELSSHLSLFFFLSALTPGTGESCLVLSVLKHIDTVHFFTFYFVVVVCLIPIF